MNLLQRQKNTTRTSWKTKAKGGRLKCPSSIRTNKRKQWLLKLHFSPLVMFMMHNLESIWKKNKTEFFTLTCKSMVMFGTTKSTMQMIRFWWPKSSLFDLTFPSNIFLFLLWLINKCPQKSIVVCSLMKNGMWLIVHWVSIKITSMVVKLLKRLHMNEFKIRFLQSSISPKATDSTSI